LRDARRRGLQVPKNTEAAVESKRGCLDVADRDRKQTARNSLRSSADSIFLYCPIRRSEQGPAGKGNDQHAESQAWSFRAINLKVR